MQHNEAEMTAQEHAAHIMSLLQEAKQECREDMQRVSDPKAQALFETTAEVVEGLCNALNHYQQGSEEIWRS